MGIRTMEESRQLTLREHIERAQRINAEDLAAITRLSEWLLSVSVVPIVGAGASFDCGVRVAGEIAEDLHTDYLANPDYAPHDQALTPQDLAAVTEAIRLKTDQVTVVRELGFPEPEMWRNAEHMGDHFCVYCVLARMAREGFLTEAIGFNYDCGAEAGLKSEGFEYGEIRPGRQWLDHARVIADAVTNSSLVQDGAFKLYKGHGCAARYREVALTNEEQAAHDIVVCKSQLENWDGFEWMKDPFRDRARNHVLLFIGFSGQDPKTANELTNVLTEVYDSRQPDGTPRVIAIDLDPSQPAIQNLIEAGLGGAEPLDGTVTEVRTENSTATGALLILLTELIASSLSAELDNENVALPDDLDARLATLVISAPTMLRWSYLLRDPADDELIQRANVMAQNGYVPLTDRPATSARLIAARHELHRRLGSNEHESSAEAASNYGFLIHQGIAYLPVGIDHAQLSAACRNSSELEGLRSNLLHPKNVDCVMVSGKGNDLRGVNLATGEEVEIDWVG